MFINKYRDIYFLFQPAIFAGLHILVGVLDISAIFAGLHILVGVLDISAIFAGLSTCFIS